MKLSLKWGSIKGWSGFGPNQIAIAKRWQELEGGTISAALSNRSSEINAVVCELIDSVDKNGGKFWNDWLDKYMTAQEAKDYILNYDN
jgi:hypothetical protein